MRPEKLAAVATLAALPAPDEELQHKVECGLLHSKIPLCCVLFFVIGWYGLTQREKDDYNDLHDRFFAGSYIPCPDCFVKFLETGIFKNIRGCNCECTCCGCRKGRDPEYVCPHGAHLEDQVPARSVA